MKNIMKVIQMFMVNEVAGGFDHQNKHIWKLMTWHNNTTVCRLNALYRDTEPDTQMYVYRGSPRKKK